MKLLITSFTLCLLMILLAWAGAASAAEPSATLESENSYAAAIAREQASLTATRDALAREIGSIEQRLRAEEALLKKKAVALEQEALRLTVQTDEAQSRYEEIEKKNRTALAGSQIEVTVSDLTQAIDVFEGKPSVATKVAEPLRGFEVQVERGLAGLNRAQQIRVTAGSFYDASGVERQGTVTLVGESAAWGRWVDRGDSLPTSTTHDVVLAPNGKAGWIEIARDDKGTLQKLVSKVAERLDAVVFSEVKSKVDHSIAASFADRAAGFAPLFWLGLLGLAVTGLFVAIART
ncbi:MAG: hypothetical protein IPJ84_04270 [Bdellovibrionales bacterium]|nr:hypothetical protein [Bdellovibrionales bacterium]